MNWFCSTRIREFGQHDFWISFNMQWRVIVYTCSAITLEVTEKYRSVAMISHVIFLDTLPRALWSLLMHQCIRAMPYLDPNMDVIVVQFIRSWKSFAEEEYSEPFAMDFYQQYKFLVFVVIVLVLRQNSYTSSSFECDFEKITDRVKFVLFYGYDSRVAPTFAKKCKIELKLFSIVNSCRRKSFSNTTKRLNCPLMSHFVRKWKLYSGSMATNIIIHQKIQR